tara:strand:+ start:146 stop:1108 length:963 start_codon:yes stop_codon:yes gene_type:complete
MLKKLYVFLPLVIFFHISCVENIIFIQVYPDGQTYFKFISTGDSTDINDQDFRHPFKDNITVNSSSNITKTDSVWTIITEAIYKDSIFAFQPKYSLGFNFMRSEKITSLSSVYNFNIEFIGRTIKNNYPLLYEALLNNKLDSLEWLPEALTIIINQSLIDLENDTTKYNFKNKRARIVNHFKNSFARIKTYEDLKTIQKNRLEYIITTLKPFKIDSQFCIELAERMKVHEDYLKSSLDLKDDSFIIKLLLPGEILSTNSMSMDQDTLVWKFGLDSLLNENYLLSSTSVIYSKKKIQKTSILVVCFLLIFGIVLVGKQKKI